MKKIKSAIKIILCCLLCIGTASSLTSCRKKKTEETITRGEWAELLGNFFGMNQPMMDSPYYSDVTLEHPSFLYIQAEREWELFEDEKEFRPDENATWEFVVKSAVIASGELDSIEDPAERFEQALIYAKEEKLIKNLKKKTLQKEISKEDSVELANWAANHYLNRDFVEYEKIETKEDVQDFSDVENLVVSPVENEETKQRTITDISGNLSGVKTGDVIIIPGDEENPDGLAQEVINISQSEDGKTTITTTEPKLEDLVEVLEFAEVFVPDLNDVKTEEGVTLLRETASNDPSILTVGSGSTSKGTDLIFSVKVNNKGKIDIGGEISKHDSSADWIEYKTEIASSFNQTEDTESFWNTLTRSDKIPDLKKIANEWTEKKDPQNIKEGKEIIQADEEKEDPYQGSYSLTGKAGIKNFRIISELKLEKIPLTGIPVGIKELEIGVEGEFFFEFDLVGKLDTEVKLCTVPIAANGLTFNVDIFLYMDANGEIKARSSVTNKTVAEYNKGRFKTIAEFQDNQSLEGSISIEPGVGARGTLKFFGVDIVDATAKAGAKAKMSGEIEKDTKMEIIDTVENTSKKQTFKVTETLSWTTNTVLTAPIITFELGTGKTLAKKIGVTLKCNVVGEKGALLSAGKIDCLKQSNSIPWCQYVSGRWDIYSREYEVELDSETLRDEYDSRNDEMRIGDQLTIDNLTLYLDLNESKYIKITMLPEGYTSKDIVFSIEDPVIAKVDSYGTVTALHEGATNLIAKTSDGKYETKCYISVSAPQMTFQPLLV